MYKRENLKNPVKNKNLVFHEKMWSTINKVWEELNDGEDTLQGYLLHEQSLATQKEYIEYGLNSPFCWLFYFNPDSHGKSLFDEMDELVSMSSIDTSVLKTLKEKHQKGFTKYRVDNVKTPDYKDYVLFTMQDVFVPEMIFPSDVITKNLVEEICLWAKDNKRNIVIRWHPTMKEKHIKPYEWWNRIQNKNEYTFFDVDSNIVQLIQNCDMLWTKFSSTGLEAMLYGKPVACFQDTDYMTIANRVYSVEEASSSTAPKERDLHQFLTFYTKHFRVDLTNPNHEDIVRRKMQKYFIDGVRDLKEYYYD
jgi:capsule polysaccharide export protein KpsC/LpsZ